VARRRNIRAPAGLTAPFLGPALCVVLAAGALAGCADPHPTLIYAERPCYRTLADVDCHAAPLAGEETRRVGFYDPPVAVKEEPWPQRLF
jgi:hypothetical protein